MLWLPKWLKTEERPDELDLSRRAFSFGLLGAAVSLAVPSPPLGSYENPAFLEVVGFDHARKLVTFSSRDMRIPLTLKTDGLDGIKYHHDKITGLWLGLERSPVTTFNYPSPFDDLVPAGHVERIDPDGTRTLLKVK